MKFSRALLPLLFAFALLFAQQGAATHELSHILAQQQDKQAPHSDACEQCAAYAQLGGVLNSATHAFAVAATSTEMAQHRAIAFHSLPVLAAAARGPPVFLNIA